MSDNDVPKLRTVGVIAEELGISIGQVQHLIQRHKIRAVGRAGSLRVFSREAVEFLRAVLSGSAAESEV
jgi:excisionase family DNA binding protein